MPRVVIPGVPILIPEATEGGNGSNGIAFLFVVIPAEAKAPSPSLPVTPEPLRSSNTRWVSVPPVIQLNPLSIRILASNLELAKTCFW